MANLTSLLTFILIVFVSSVTAPSCDEYILVLRWSKSFCLQPPHCQIPNIPNRFTLHGFWPQNRTGPNHEYCSSLTAALFDPSIGKNRGAEGWHCISNLHQAWPDLKEGKDETFWKTQWNKHGTCSTYDYRPQEYFCKPTGLYYALNVNDLLGNLRTHYSVVPAPYLPEQGQVHGYSVDELKKAFNGTLGGGNTDIYIECKLITVKDRNDQPHVLPFLWEIRVYYDPKLTKIPSPIPFSHCDTRYPVYFPL